MFVGAVLVVGLSIAGLHGQPTISGGRYLLNDHGSLSPVTRAAYEHALVLQQRVFTLIPAIFFAIGVIAHHPGRRVGGDAVLHA